MFHFTEGLIKIVQIEIKEIWNDVEENEDIARRIICHLNLLSIEQLQVLQVSNRT